MEMRSKIIWLILLLVSGALAICGVGMGVGGVILVTVPFGFICAHIFARKFLGQWAGNQIAFGIYYPAKNVTPPPPEFPVIRAKIANEKYDEAVSDLEKLLEKDPGNYHVIALLIDIFVDKTHDGKNAYELITAYLRKGDRIPQDVPIVMKLVDVYLDNDAPEKAVELLNSELKKKYHPKDLKALGRRLEGIARNT
ncbi:MAG: hypothetical protein WC637_13115 [Victivallales bacterium]|jgi:uncharacterized protein HemY